MEKETKEKVLQSAKFAGEIILVTAAIGMSFVCPNLPRYLLKGLVNHLRENQYDHFSTETIRSIPGVNLSKALYSLKRRKLIEITHADGITTIKLTEKGREMKLMYDFDNLSIRKPEVWDGKWRVIIFDIPETKKSSREAFRRKLKIMGFSPFQKSVWLHPYPCESEIDFLSEKLKIAEFLNLITVQIDNDEPLRTNFNL